MARQKKAAGASAPVVTAKAPKGAVRVLVRVRRTGRTMRMSSGEARALHALNVVEYVEAAPVPPVPAAPTYQRRDMVARRAPAVTATYETKDDGEAA